MARTEDLTGKTFGRWTVIEKAGKDRKGGTLWKCICECGTESNIRHSSLTSGNSRSCGCYHKDITSKTHLKHGNYGTRLYGVWNAMKQRCLNPNNHKYKDYGGRGIEVCDSWKEFSNFEEWAIDNGYDENAMYGDCTLDRINVDGNYEPDNCRWADAKTQANNKRKNNNQYTINHN